MTSGNPDFDELTHEQQQHWIEKAQQFTGNVDDPQYLTLRERASPRRRLGGI